MSRHVAYAIQTRHVRYSRVTSVYMAENTLFFFGKYRISVETQRRHFDETCFATEDARFHLYK